MPNSMMPDFSKTLFIERQWTDLISTDFSDDCQSRVFSIYGPTGAGKTTVATGLEPEYQVYVENTRGNPYLSSWYAGKSDFNAVANQMWFLDRVAHFVKQCTSVKALVLDQDPAAIVLVYARLFLEDGLMSMNSYESLIKRLIGLEHELRRWRVPRNVIYLDASEAILFRRLKERSANNSPPTPAWLRRLRDRFREVYSFFPTGIECNSENVFSKDILLRFD